MNTPTELGSASTSPAVDLNEKNEREAAAMPSLDGQRLKIVIVGHVDHGKSTLIGRLLFDTGSLADGKIEQVKKAAEAEGMDFEYAFLLDALLEEQEQNITIDTTQIQFRSATRNYVIVDAPGHKEFLKNMITGAASADAAIVLLDAQEGLQEQTRRHGYLLSLLGIKQVLVAVNKMDLIGFSQDVFTKLEADYREFLKPLNITPKTFVPMSAKHGHNIVRKSEKLDWYTGPSLLEALESLSLPPGESEKPLRFLVQDVYRFDARRLIAGRIDSGKMKVGDELVFWPDRKKSKVRSFETWPKREGEAPKQEALAGESISIILEEQIFVERGHIAGRSGEHCPAEGRDFMARVFWLHAEPLEVGQHYTIKLGTQEVEAKLVKVDRLMDSSTLQTVEGGRQSVKTHEVAELLWRARRMIAFDNSDAIQTTGRFVILKEGRIGGGGVIYGAEYDAVEVQSSALNSRNLSWTADTVTREARTDHFGHRGAVLWFTGLSGSGKSTLAAALESRLFHKGLATRLIDGDNLRHGLCSDLGFSEADRAENIRRCAEVAKLMAEAGLVVITSLISPIAIERKRAAMIAHKEGIPFVEIFIKTPLEICEKRDPKGLYKKARAGEIKGFTGIDSPYEAPISPDLEIDTVAYSREECLEKLVDFAMTVTRRAELGEADRSGFSI